MTLSYIGWTLYYVPRRLYLTLKIKYSVWRIHRLYRKKVWR